MTDALVNGRVRTSDNIPLIICHHTAALSMKDVSADRAVLRKLMKCVVVNAVITVISNISQFIYFNWVLKSLLLTTNVTMLHI